MTAIGTGESALRMAAQNHREAASAASLGTARLLLALVDMGRRPRRLLRHRHRLVVVASEWTLAEELGGRRPGPD